MAGPLHAETPADPEEEAEAVAPDLRDDSHSEVAILADQPVGAPLRVRNFTFPSFLVLGLQPMPTSALGKGNYALEFHASAVNNFQVSPAVEEYLAATRPEGVRRGLDQTDIDFILGLPEGQAFYIDGEFDFLEFTGWYGVTDKLDIGLTLYHIGYTGGFLDGAIFDFHDEFGFGQQSRNFVVDDAFMIVLGADELEPVVLTSRPSSGGFSDPTLQFRWATGQLWSGWQFSLSGGVKIPMASESDFLSTGNYDVGLQVNADRRWTRDAFIVNAGLVMPGDFEQTGFDTPLLPSVYLTWIRQLPRWPKTRFMLQSLVAEHPLRDLIDTDFRDLTENEVQLTAGVKFDTEWGVFGFGLTENLFNMDNTPDIGLHFSWGYLGIGGDG